MMAFISVAPEDHWQHMSSDIAEAIKVAKKSGLNYEIGSMGTSLEGEPEVVFEVLKKMHMAIRQNSKRVSTLIKIDDQVDRAGERMEEKVASVKQKLGEI